MSSLSLKNISKIYPGTKVLALDKVSLDIADKEFVVVVGPSGCGKSTLLRVISGLEEITSGELYIDEKLMNDVAVKDRDIAMVFQNYELFPHMNVYNNLAYGLKIRHVSKDIIDKKVREAASVLDIEDLLDRRPKELSGGQRQRVALGRAIVRNPRVFLLDEPLSNLDAKLRVQMRTEIIKLHDRLNTTFVYVTHDRTEAMTMGNRIVVMKDGVVRQVDSPATIYRNPADLFVASFLCSPQLNIFKAKLMGNGTKRIIEFGENNQVELPSSIEIDDSYLNKDVLMCVRPEDVVCKKSKNGKTGISATVDVAEYMGNETILQLIVDGNSAYTSARTYEPDFVQGDKIQISFNTERILLFDPDTERAIINYK